MPKDGDQIDKERQMDMEKYSNTDRKRMDWRQNGAKSRRK